MSNPLRAGDAGGCVVCAVNGRDHCPTHARAATTAAPTPPPTRARRAPAAEGAEPSALAALLLKLGFLALAGLIVWFLTRAGRPAAETQDPLAVGGLGPPGDFAPWTPVQ